MKSFNIANLMLDDEILKVRYFLEDFLYLIKKESLKEPKDAEEFLHKLGRFSCVLYSFDLEMKNIIEKNYAFKKQLQELDLI